MPPPLRTPAETARWITSILAALVQYITLGVALQVYPQYCKTELHTSALSGRAWIKELLTGHPDRIYIALGMRRHVFLALVLQIRAMGYLESQQARIELDESLAIFLYTCVTGIAIDHVAERFQHSHTTISVYVPSYCGEQFLIWHVGIFEKSWTSCPATSSTQNMYGRLRSTIHLPRPSDRTPNSGHFSRMHWVQLMGLILTVHRLLSRSTQLVIGRVGSLRTVWQPCPLICDSCSSLVGGMGVLLTLQCTLRHGWLIFPFLLANAILQMPALEFVTTCWYLIARSGITLQNGVGPMNGMGPPVMHYHCLKSL